VQSLPPLPDTPYTATFEQVWRIVQEKHFDPTLGCQDWPALRLEFGGRLAHAKDASEAYATMNALLATLKQSHFKVVPPGGAVESEASGPARAPVHVRMIEGQLLVVDAALGGVDSGVPRGAVLVAVDGKPVAEIVRQDRGDRAASGRGRVPRDVGGRGGASRRSGRHTNAALPRSHEC
jgi:carboxyl-terminal processing protease